MLRTARYFDSAHFGARITVPSLVAMGFIDEVCTPTGIWATFNQIKGAKKAVPMVDSPHNHLATPQAQQPWNTRSAAWLATLVSGGRIEPAANGAR